MKGFMSIPSMIFYVILLIMVIHFIPSLVGFTNISLGQMDVNEPAFIVLALFPVIFFAKYLFQPWFLGENQ